MVLFKKKFLQNACSDLKKNEQVSAVPPRQRRLAANLISLLSPFALIPLLSECVCGGGRGRWKGVKRSKTEKEEE